MKHEKQTSLKSSTKQSEVHRRHPSGWFIGFACSGFIYYLLFSLTILPPTILTRRLQRCELANELYILDILKKDLPLWLCIAEYESRFNTHVIGTRNEDGSLDYGIFQISDKFWCLPENETDYFVFNDCNVNCSELLTDDITASVKCAHTVLKQQGWTAWTVYEEFCNDTLESVESCFK